MPRQILASAIIVGLLALLLSARSERALAADECVVKPGATGPPGSHWYYRVDRVTHAHCWYLGPFGQRVAVASAHAVPSLLRLPVARPTFLAGETAYASAAPVEMQNQAWGGEAPTTFAMRWLASAPDTTTVRDGASASAPMGVSYAATLAGVSETDTATRLLRSLEETDHKSAAARGSRSWALVFASLAVGLATIAMAERAMFRRSMARRGGGRQRTDFLTALSISVLCRPSSVL